jgi:hypothetical protein
MATSVPTTDSTDARPTACKLEPGDREARLREWQALRSDALISESHSDGGSVSVFRANPDVKQRIDALIQAEHDCCSHLRFNVSQDDAEITVEVTSHPQA